MIDLKKGRSSWVKSVHHVPEQHAPKEERGSVRASTFALREKAGVNA